MEIYLNIEGGGSIVFPMMPEEIKIGAGGKFMNYAVIHLGDVKIPRGESLEEYSWEGMFPGPLRYGEIYVGTYTDPETLKSILEDARDSGAKCQLTVTGTQINAQVYIDKFSGRYSGGHGDFFYDIKFVDAVDIMIYTVIEYGKMIKKKKKKKKRARAKTYLLKSDTSKDKTMSVTVKSGQNVWQVAQMHLGDGSRYTEVQALNANVISAHKKGPTAIQAGDSLQLPST